MKNCKELETLKNLEEIACSNGNWNYNSYLHGMANGIILAVAVMENRSPEYLEAPDVWLCDKHSNKESQRINEMIIGEIKNCFSNT